MRILVTGAAGNLGRAVIPSLTTGGHTVRAFDLRPPQAECEFVRGDVRQADEVAGAVDGVDAVVHGAALHGVHLGTWSPHDFWSTNVTGTFNVYEAARAANARRVVLCSTMGVYGDAMEPAEERWAVVTEETPARPRDVYALSKLLCEELAQYFSRTAEIATVALRLGMFVPETFDRYGFRLLFGGVDDRDVAQAVLRALHHDPENGFDYVNVMAPTPLGAADAEALASDLAGVLEEHWPGSTALFRERGLDVDELIWGRTLWPVDKARGVLGYRGQYGFGEFVDALRRNDRDHYPVTNLPQWGVESS